MALRSSLVPILLVGGSVAACSASGDATPEPTATVQQRDSVCNNTSPLVWAGGPTIHDAQVHLVFWLPPGTHFVDGGDAESDLKYEWLLQQFFTDVESTTVFQVVTQYGDTAGAPHSVTFVDASVRTSDYGGKGSASNPLMEQDIENAVADEMDHNGRGWQGTLSDVYFVYTAAGVQSCGKDTTSCTLAAANFFHSAGSFAGYHDWFMHGIADVLFANMPSAASIGYAVPDPVPAAPNDAAIDPTITMSSHELFESMSDPYVNSSSAAWSLDSVAHCEMGDKCGTFGTLNARGANIVLPNGHEYILQDEWSNAFGGCTTNPAITLPPRCSVPSRTSCASEWVPAPTSAYETVSTIPITCPGSASPDAFVEVSPSGDTTSLGNFCPDLANPGVTTPDLYAIGGQYEHTTTWGAPIGSTKAVAACALSGIGNLVCDPPSNVTVVDCCPTMSDACFNTCGTVSNGCGGTYDCGDCPTGETCQNNKCIAPATCHTPMACCLQNGGVWRNGRCVYV
jgi:hypothetical protein